MRHTKLGRRLLLLVILSVSCLLLGGCPDSGGRSCSECAQVEFKCQNDCADEPDVTDCAAACASARKACDENCTKLE